MALSEYRLLSRPAEVIFAGFRSTTYELQQAGWKLSMSQDPYRGSIQLVMRHDGAALYMMAEEVRLDFMGYYHDNPHKADFRPDLTFVIRKCSSQVMVQTMMDMSRFSAIDAVPQWESTPVKRIEDFKIFASPLVRTEEIIVEPQSVAECLELIRKMQSPELAEIRKRNAQRDRDQPINQQNFHAQVISLAA